MFYLKKYIIGDFTLLVKNFNDKIPFMIKSPPHNTDTILATSSYK